MIFIVFVFGLLVGSFLNVCICRIPDDLSVVAPRSMCPKCNNLIKWYDNIPVLSYLILGAKCRYCSKKISIQYPIIELLFAFMCTYLYVHFGSQYFVVYYGVLSGCLLVATVIDLKHYIIPDEVNIVGVVVGVGGAVIFPQLVGGSGWLDGLVHSVLGIAVGFSVLRIVVVLGKIIFRKEAMGLGDPKFLAMIGAFLGYKSVLLIIFISSLLGALIGSVVVYGFRKDKSDTAIPYGPFLAVAAYVTLFYGQYLIDWYTGLLTID